MSTAMITALTWIPRGAARERPVRFELSEEEYSRIKHLAALEEAGERDQKEEDRGIFDDSEDDDVDEVTEEDGAASALPAEYKMDEYDNEELDVYKPKKGSSKGNKTSRASSKRAESVENVDEDEESLDAPMALHDENDEDEIALMESHGVALAMDADSEDEDADDDQIRPTDSLLVVAMTEDEHSHLEVQLLNEEGHMYVHHDVALPEFPLCLAWLDCPPYRDQTSAQAPTSGASPAATQAAGQVSVGNYVAVGTFQCGIEIWNLDVLDPIEPTAVLGGELVDEELAAYMRAKRKHSKSSDKVKKSKKMSGNNENGDSIAGFEGVQQTEDGRVLKSGSHSDAVMCLSWNREYRQALASGSADGTVKIWDVTTRTCSHTFTHHADKVQSVAWHPKEAWLLASGSFDGTVTVMDCRSGTITATFSTPADVESMQWDPHCIHLLYVACENGDVLVLDIRHGINSTPVPPVSVFKAHDKTVSSLSCSASIPGFLVTASVDKTVRVWDTLPLHSVSNTTATAVTTKKGSKNKDSGKSHGSSTLPKLIAQKALNAGKLFSVQCFADSPFVLAAGGDKGSVAVWLSDELDTLRTHFESRLVSSTGSSVGNLHTNASIDPLRAQPGGTAQPVDLPDVDETGGAAYKSRERAFAQKEDEGDSASDSEGPEADMDDSWMDAEVNTSGAKNKKNSSASTKQSGPKSQSKGKGNKKELLK